MADVNVIVSAIIGPLGLPRAIIAAWQAGGLDFITSEGIIAEVDEKLRSPRIARKYGLSDEDIGVVVSLLRSEAEVVVVRSDEIAPVTGDPEDDYVLATAQVAGADYLVTGDTKLQSLHNYATVPIVSPRTFLDELARRSKQ